MTNIERPGLALSIAVAVAALSLLAWQWAEQARRISSSSDDESRYLRRQDVRRLLVSILLFTLSALILIGSRTEPRVFGRPNVLFLELWLSIVALTLVVLLLALVDWFATRQYARRLRSFLVRESVEILRETFQESGSRPLDGTTRG